MTSFSRARAAANRAQAPTITTGGNPMGQKICLVVGFTCIVGFLMDMLVLGSPPNPMSLEWRINFLQQAGDRSIVFLFGIALLLYGVFDQHRIKKPLAFATLALGVAFLLSSVLVIRDSLTLKEQAFRNISIQEEQLQTRIEETQESGELPPEISPDQLLQASQEIAGRAQTMKQNATQGITKAGTASVGNLVVVGIGMMGLGRIGMKRSR